MRKKRMTMLVLSCDSFSDLWDGHLKMLEANWPDREMETCIVAEGQSVRDVPNARIIAAGPAVEWSDRLKYALHQVETDYVFITLDDYYLVKRVENQKINAILDMMLKENVDYVRLFPHPKRATKEAFKGYPHMNRIDTNLVYSVNLYSGIWKKSFLDKTIQQPKNAWQFEVSLAKAARENDALCVVSRNNEFVILDVVRKGKLLRKAAQYFRKHPGIYDGNREVNSWEFEFKLGIQTLVSRYAPQFIAKAIRSFMISRGYHFYSQDADE